MDTTEMTSKEMVEKIAELEYSQSQLRDLNAEMRHWLDVADDEMSMLRSENDTLTKQVKVLKNVISEAQQVKAEPCRSLLATDDDVKRCSEKKIEKLEKESAMMKEQNKKLTAELKSLQQERDQDKISLNKFRVALQTLECGTEEAQLVLQNRDEAILQKNLQIEHLEKSVEEHSNVIKDLRLTNQTLRQQLEDRQDETSFAILNETMEEKDGLRSSPLSIAEEIKLLVSSGEQKTSTTDFTDLRHEETEAEEPEKIQSLALDLQTKRCAGVLKRALQIAGLFMLFIFFYPVLAFMTSGNFAGKSDFSSINTVWSSCYVLRPYCRVQYGALPPI